MAFKRYINKHGKKLGPYYYENVRGPDGSVKTIYLGTNPKDHQKHKIRKPLFFLIIVLVLILLLGSLLFFWQNKAYLIKKVSLQEADFDVDQILLKVLIRSNEFIEKQVRIMNTGNKPTAINAEAYGLDDVVKIDSPSFALKPGQTKVVALNFSSFVPEQKIEQQPGIYVGKLVVKSEKAAKEIPIVVEIETRNVLFDMNLNPVAIERKVKQGSDTTIEVRIFNLQSIESSSVDVDYFVKDINGNTIVTESETVVVKTQASFFKTISIPKNLKPGPYVFASRARFGDSIGTASYMFEVTGPETEDSFVGFCKNSVVCLGLSLTTILLLFALIAYFYFFIGAYLYEKVTGSAALPAKRKEEAEEEAEEAIEAPRVSIFARIKGKIEELKIKREEAKTEKERAKRKDELKRLAEDREAQLEARRREMEEERKKIQEERRLADLRRDERRKLELERQKAEEEQRQLEEKKKAREEEIRADEEYKIKKSLEREKLRKERKEKSKEFFHKLGLYKTPEEKAQIALQKEREKQEKLRKEEEFKRQKEAEAKRQEEERKKQLELRKKEEELLRKQKELEAKRLEKEQQEQRKQEEKLKKLEDEKARNEELKKAKEEQKKSREAEKLRLQEKRKSREEEKKRKPKPEERLLTEKAKEKAELEPEEKKPSLFKRLFKKEKPEIKEAEETKKEKQTEQEKLPLSETEELEEAIKGLGLFRKLEKEVSGKKEPEKKQRLFGKLLKKKEHAAEKPKIAFKEEKIKKITVGKSKKSSKFQKVLNEAKEALGRNDTAKAKKLYVEARELYVGLEYQEKKEVYDELMEFYNQLLK